MATEITMPKLSDTMEEGTILKWRVKPGETIAGGDIIAEVETDKAAMEMEAYEAGTVSDLKVAEGETVPVGTVIAVLNGAAAEPAREEKKETAKPAAPERGGGAGPEAKSQAKAEQQPPEEGQELEGEEAEEEEEEKEAPPEPAAEPAKMQQPETEEKKKAPVGRPRLDQQELVASPAARRLAEQKGVDLTRVRGTGPGGRIVVADVELMTKGRAPESSAPARNESEARAADVGKRAERSVKIRHIVGRKMVESWQTTPHFFVTVAVDMTDLIRIRKSLGASINDFIIAAAARCLRDYPWVNSHWVDGDAVEQGQINISMAVATERGLYNPVLRDCGKLSLHQISRRANDLVQRAHAGRLGAEELAGGTFTISNMGMLGVESFSAIITPPQAAVLAVGTVRGEVVVGEKGEPVVAPQLRLTLSADHRVLDGADAAEFLTGMKSYLEAPVTLVTSDYGKE